jgi:uncharacterized protein
MAFIMDGGVEMPVPHEEMRRIIKRRIRGLEGTDRIRVLKAALEELPGYYQGPYGQVRKWILGLIEEAETRREVRHQESYFLPKQGAAQVVLVGPPNAGKSSLLNALTGRDAVVADYPFTTLRPVEGMVVFGGARVQLVDLPGLIDGAADGKGGGRSVLAAVRIADAMLQVVPLSPEGLSDALRLDAEVRGEGIDLPSGVVATKSDLDGAEERLAEVRAAFAGRGVAACSAPLDEGLESVRQLIWDLSGLIRVYLRPRGGRVSPDPVVLARGGSIADLTGQVNRAWLSLFRAAHVTGPSARFDEQQVGLEHVLLDGDVVELVLE